MMTSTNKEMKTYASTLGATSGEGVHPPPLPHANGSDHDIPRDLEVMKDDKGKAIPVIMRRREEGKIDLHRWSKSHYDLGFKGTNLNIKRIFFLLFFLLYSHEQKSCCLR